jgi:hypothetical protein
MYIDPILLTYFRLVTGKFHCGNAQTHEQSIINVKQILYTK